MNPTIAARAAARLARQVERALADADLSLPQYRVLGILADQSEAAGGLAERLAVSPPSVTSVLDGLVARSLVERHADPVDRRRQAVALTDAGRAALVRGDTVVEARLAEVAGHLPPARAERAMRALEEWSDALDAARIEKLARKA